MPGTWKSSWRDLSQEELAAKLAAAGKRHTTTTNRMTAEQMDIESRMLSSMYQRLTFLRNPRYPLPSSVANMKKELTQRRAGGWTTSLTSGKNASPMKAQLTAKPGVIFVLEPPEVIFTDYSVGEVQEITLLLRNVTCVIQTLRIHPSCSPYFFVSMPKFPGPSSEVAPGMCAEVTIRFTADSLADYEDFFTVDTPRQRSFVPLVAKRPPPLLTLPEVVDVGDVLCGNSQSFEFTFSNIGGPGQFQLSQSQSEGEIDHHLCEEVSVGDFMVWPPYFDLRTDKQATLHVRFSPKSCEKSVSHISFICDNCQVKDFTLTGCGVPLGIVIEQLDDMPLEGTRRDMPVWFGEVTSGASRMRQLHLKNTTGVPFSFRWVLASDPVLAGPPGTSRWQGPGQAWEDTMEGFNRDGPDGDNSQHIATTSTSQVLAGFSMEPSYGVIHAKEVLPCTVSFNPSKAVRYLQWAHLVVNRQLPHDMASTGVSNAISGPEDEVVVVEVNLEGQGCHPQVTLTPSSWHIQGPMLPGTVRQQGFTLVNLSEAPIPFHVKGFPPHTTIRFYPESGTLPPAATINLEGELVAPSAPGSLDVKLQVVLGNVVVIPFAIQGLVERPHVQVVTNEVDFGLVHLNSTSQQYIQLLNSTRECGIEWHMEQVGGQGPGPASTYLELQPSSGTLSPGEIHNVEVLCHAGCTGICDMVVVCTSGGHRESIRVVAAVTSPKLKLSTSRVDLGVTYQGVVVQQMVKYSNISKLPCQCLWAVCYGGEEGDLEAELGLVDIRPSAEHLQPGEEASLSVSFTPIQPGNFSAYIVASIPPAQQPIGFLLTSIIKGCEVVYEVMDEETWTHLEAKVLDCDKTGSSSAATSSALVSVDKDRNLSEEDSSLLSGRTLSVNPDPGQTASTSDMSAEFGGVSIDSCKHMYVLVRNQTAIRTNVTAWVHQYPMEGSPKEYGWNDGHPEESLTVGFKSTRQLSAHRRQLTSGGPAQSTLRLSASHEKQQPFYSSSGKAMMTSRRAMEESQRTLGNKGVVFVVDPGTASLEPWGMVVIKISCHNNMCGEYQDTLTVQVAGQPARVIPLRVLVVGSPLTMQKERVLIPGLRGKQWSLSLDCGATATTLRTDRSFYVFNTSSLDMQVSWRSYNYDLTPDCQEPTINGPDGFQVQFKYEPAGIRLQLEPPYSHQNEPFEIVPQSEVIHGGSSQKFTVVFQSDVPQLHEGFLLGEQHLLRERPRSPLSTDDPEESQAGAHLITDTPYPLNPLRVDLRALTVTPHLEVDVSGGLSWTVSPPMPGDTGCRPHQQTVVLANTLACGLTFEISTSGPSFRVVSTQASIAQDENSFRGTVGFCSMSSGSTYLIPGASVTVVVDFLLAGIVAPGGPYEDQLVSGALDIRFSTGHVQVIPLRAEIIYPEVSVTPSTLDFSTIHMSSRKTLDITLVNKTTTDAHWVIQGELIADTTRVGTTQQAGRTHSSASCFKVSPARGVLPGRGLKMPRQQRVQVSFSPTNNTKCEETFRVVVENGRGSEFHVVGTGTFDEAQEC